MQRMQRMKRMQRNALLYSGMYTLMICHACTGVKVTSVLLVKVRVRIADSIKRDWRSQKMQRMQKMRRLQGIHRMGKLRGIGKLHGMGKLRGMHKLH
jgi:hypothetical protein